MLEQLRAQPAYSRLAFGQFRPYPLAPRQKADIWIGEPLEWVIEVKMARFVGDNGRPDDMAIKDLLSPYPADRSAVTDCKKLAESAFDCPKAIVIYGFESVPRALDPALRAFELVASDFANLGPRHEATFEGLVHPFHVEGKVCAWEVTPKA
jgi:hypothetical protein